MSTDWFSNLAGVLLKSPVVHRGEWQSRDVSWSQMHATFEAVNVVLDMPIPASVDEWADATQPNRTWADEHFLERVGGIPVNPPPSHKRWPWARHNSDHQNEEELFSHTYPERFWPKYAGTGNAPVPPVFDGNHHRGIRFAYGDLRDVANLLTHKPHTRQAYLPVWFPEDTGAVHGQRVPCTLGYHFLMTEGRLWCFYAMRSCDLVRHLRDDVYLAGRLTQWLCGQVNNGPFMHRDPSPSMDRPGIVRPFIPGQLVMTISSLHAFYGDKWKLEQFEGGEV